VKIIFKLNCFSICILTIGYAFKLSVFYLGDEIFQLSSIFLALGLIFQAIYFAKDTDINKQGLRLFFILNSLVLAFSFIAIVIKTGHVGLTAIKHITFDIFTTILLTSCLVYDFSIIDRLISATNTVKAAIHRHITFIFIFLILSIIYMALYSETTNRMDIIEMIENGTN
jgi:hypothetical protein